ncbi:MAG: YciI family protein [Sneathiella sp.]
MFIVLLTFAENKSKAGDFMEGHKNWIKRGFEAGHFLLVGSLQPNRGGAILAHNATLSEIDAFVKEDPFVVEEIVTVEILEITPAQAADEFKFLLD